MFDRIRKISNLCFLVALGAPLLLTSACSANGPWPMPSGYAHHQYKYKAPPGPEPVFKKWESRLKKDGEAAPSGSMCATACAADSTPADSMPVESVNAQSTMPVTTWQSAANELVSRMAVNFGKPTEAIFVRPAAAGNSQLEQILRDALQAQGMSAAAGPGTSPFVLSYATQQVSDRTMLTITLSGVAGMLDEESGMYNVDGTAAPAPASAMMPASDAPGGPMSIAPPAGEAATP